MGQPSTVLSELSDALANVVEKVRPSIVRVDDGTRLTASGIVWSDTGTLLATSHGVERDNDLWVETNSGHRFPATLVGRDPDTDIAVLQSREGLDPIERAALADARVGHLVLAIGRPGDAGLQATIGIIGSRQETNSANKSGYLLHTDAVLYPGFSGGPLVDTSGRLVGMNNLLYGRGRGIAIGTPVLETVAEALIRNGRIRRGYLGVRTQNVKLYEGSQDGGALVVQVEPGSPAAKGGLLLGDTILAVDGARVEDVDDLRRALRSNEPGQSPSIGVLRGGQQLQLEVTLVEEE